jgi:hypothetical protein
MTELCAAWLLPASASSPVTSAPTDPNGTAPGDPLVTVAIIAIGVVGLALFFLPIFIASKRHVRPLRGVVIVNLLSLFFLPVWLLALVMAIALKGSANKPIPQNSYGPSNLPAQAPRSGGIDFGSAHLGPPRAQEDQTLKPEPAPTQMQMPPASQMSDQTLNAAWHQLDPRDSRNDEIDREEAHRAQLRRDEANRLEMARAEQRRQEASARHEREERDRQDREERDRRDREERDRREEQDRRDREDRERRS